MRNQDAVDRYARYLRVVRDCSERTVETYLGQLGGLAKFLQARHLSLLEAAKRDILEYRESLNRMPRGIRIAI